VSHDKNSFVCWSLSNSFKGFDFFLKKKITFMRYLVDKQYRPNVRTFNTLARGCLWNAATLIKESKNCNDMCKKREISEERTTVIGGVLSLEEAWLRSKELHMNYDVSSFEYSVTALCFALRVADAEQRISEMKEAIQSPCDLNDSLIVCLVALSRAYAMLGRKKEAKKNAEAALSIILHLPYNDSSKSSRLGEKKQRHIVGGTSLLVNLSYSFFLHV